MSIPRHFFHYLAPAFLDDEVDGAKYKAFAPCNLRNICAHQDRLWNNPITGFPPATHKTYSIDFTNPTSFYSRAVVIQLLMRELGLNGWWRDSLLAVLASCAHVDPRKHLGFPGGLERPTGVGLTTGAPLDKS